MKRAITVALLVLALASPKVDADVGSSFVILNAVSADSDSATYDISKASTISAQVWSTAGSVGIVRLQTRSNAAAPWFTVTTITDPSTTGEYWSIPLSMQFRADLSGYGSGNITVVLETHQITN
jgi:hypothetical protein